MSPSKVYHIGLKTMWIIAAVCSSLFAGLTAVLSKIGLKGFDSDLATAIRTSVVLVFAWVIALCFGEIPSIVNINGTSWLFLILSGLATGASWICYFKALSLGEASKVSAVDKTSLIFSILLALAIFPDERDNWWLKLIFLVLLGVGTFLMCDFKKGGDSKSKAWLIFGFLSAIFAAGTSILAKLGIDGVPSNLATAIRTSVVFLLAWLIALCRKKLPEIKKADGKTYLFLILSGLATGLSWMCYYYALKEGQVSVVVPIDKCSVLITVLFSVIFLKEKVSIRQWSGLALILAGTICMALFT